MRAIYTLLLYLATPLLLVPLLWQCARGRDSWRRLGERFGRVRMDAPVADWVHCASVGEFAAALPLIRRLAAARAPRAVLVTTTTATASARVAAALGETVQHCYVPHDVPHVLSRFLARVRPARVVVMETELWPNLFAALRARGVPLVVASARMSARSQRGYARVPRLIGDTLAACRLIAAQSEDDAQRFRALGADPARVAVIGNLKFDVELPAELVARGGALRAQLGAARPVWVAASTHDGEDEFALTAHRILLKRFPDALLILVPRHPGRFATVARLIEQSGVAFARRSSFAHFPSPEAQVPGPVLLADSMGELPLYLAAADAAFVGGSLVPVGGHNVLEPAALGVPVLFGPYLFNFEAAGALLLAAGAARQVETALDLAPAVSVLFADAAQRRRMGEAAREVVAANRGALERLLQLIEKI